MQEIVEIAVGGKDAGQIFEGDRRFEIVPRRTCWQRYQDGSLSDVTTFKAGDGLTWIDSAGRSFTMSLKELSDWRGNRADAGRLAPKGFPKNNHFGRLPEEGRNGGGEAK